MRTAALIKRIFQQMLRDKRTLALLFVAPLLVLTLMNLVFNGKTVDSTIGVENVSPAMITQFKAADIKVETFNQTSSTKNTMEKHDLDAFLKIENGRPELTLLNTDPTAAKSLQMKIKQMLSTQKAAAKDPIQTHYIYGSKDTGFFDVVSPILIGFFVFFFVFLISGVGLLKERTTGTLERLMATPIKRGEIVLAYLIGFGAFAVIQTIIVVFYAINVLDVVLVGSIWNVLLVNLLLALVALSLGILLSSFAASEFQMVQFIPVVVIPQVFFSGIFPIEGMADWLQALTKIMPLYYAADALKGVMYKGFAFSDIMGDILVLMIFAAVFIILNLFALKKYRKL
ncbi:ABC transporter permease [Peribacillus kribbensis]|uniref:ABC transporter permease n=1 Tax=Peribacillus kribbensis TaxID=356658 RepID=UPI0004157811|nr:ABC transporter permease [Peribacillus kribbensis]